MSSSRFHILIYTVMALLFVMESGLPCFDCWLTEEKEHSTEFEKTHDDESTPCSSPLSHCLGCSCTCHTLLVATNEIKSLTAEGRLTFPAFLVPVPPIRALSPPD